MLNDYYHNSNTEKSSKRQNNSMVLSIIAKKEATDKIYHLVLINNCKEKPERCLRG